MKNMTPQLNSRYSVKSLDKALLRCEFVKCGELWDEHHKFNINTALFHTGDRLRQVVNPIFIITALISDHDKSLSPVEGVVVGQNRISFLTPLNRSWLSCKGRMNNKLHHTLLIQITVMSLMLANKTGRLTPSAQFYVVLRTFINATWSINHCHQSPNKAKYRL